MLNAFKEWRIKMLEKKFHAYGRKFWKYRDKMNLYIGNPKKVAEWSHWHDKCRHCLDCRDKILNEIQALRG